MVITDKLASYVPAIRRVLPKAEHRRHKRLNNRAENSHLPTRKRERVLQRFKSAEHPQRFLGPFSAVCNHFRPRRHRLTASTYRHIRTERHATWLQVMWGGKTSRATNRRCRRRARTHLAAANDRTGLGAPAPGPCAGEPAPASPARRLDSADSQPTACWATHLGQAAVGPRSPVVCRWRRHLVLVTPETVVGCSERAGACAGAGSRVPAADARM
jgi:hypothetical protein